MQPPLNQTQKAILSYFSPQPHHSTTKPYELTPEAQHLYPSRPASNLVFETRVVEIEDVRGREGESELDVHSFCFLRSRTRVRDLRDEREVEEKYLGEIEELIKMELERDGGNLRVHVFSWKVRSSAPSTPRSGEEEGEGGISNGKSEIAPPTRHPHVDQSAEGTRRRVRRHLPGEAEDLLRGWVRIVNVWRPLQKVTAWPLALCDTRSVARSDLIPKEQIGKHLTGESYLAKYGEGHKWCYLGGMERDEVVVMKIFDSREKRDEGGEGVDCCLHCSFELEGEGWEGVRESIEVRAMVFDELGDEEAEDGWVMV
ncbi:hypothetical protein N431DRAFT_320768 [Stipitochalara longipes BDJ]|nr:hypothetical protein N431DRAFT_320768 [Stipitochalara longipes BDJ]